MAKEEIYKKLIESLKLVASSANIQTKSLPQFVVITDEIALTYHDAFLMLPQLKNMIPIAVIDKLQKLDCLFDEMSEFESLWSIESLKEHVCWEECRALAKESLDALGVKYSEPDLSFMSFVE